MSRKTNLVENSRAVIHLRPHHLICMLGWRDRGYDQAFSDNFNRIIKMMKDNTLVRLVDGGDDVCSSCPHYGPPECHRQDNTRLPRAIDTRVLDKLNVDSGGTYRFGFLRRRLIENISPSDLSDICADCTWLPHGWCRSGLAIQRSAGGT